MEPQVRGPATGPRSRPAFFKGDWRPLLALVPIGLILLGFEVLPALGLVAGSFLDNSGQVTLKHYQTILTNPFYHVSIRNSLGLALTSTVLGLIIGLLGSYALSRSSERVRQGMITFISMCINFAGVPLAFAFVILLGNSGLITTLLTDAFRFNLYDHFSLYSWFGLGIVYTYFQIPLAILLLYPAFHAIRPEWEEAAAILGARPFRFWWSVGLPVLSPALVSTTSILFANALGAYATAYSISNGIFNILPLRISRLVSGEVNYNPGLASAAAMALALLMVLALVTSQMVARQLRKGAAA